MRAKRRASPTGSGRPGGIGGASSGILPHVGLSDVERIRDNSDDDDDDSKKLHRKKGRGEENLVRRWKMMFGRFVLSVRSQPCKGIVRLVRVLGVVAVVLLVCLSITGWNNNEGRSFFGGGDGEVSARHEHRRPGKKRLKQFHEGMDGYYGFDGTVTSRLAESSSATTRMAVKNLLVPKLKKGIQDMSTLGYRSKPLSLGCYFRDAETSAWLGTQRLDPYLIRRHRKLTTVYVPSHELQQQRHLLDSHDYKYGLADPAETDDCKAQYPWQKMSHPTCNNMHEADLTDLHASQRSKVKVRLLSNGYWRDVWLITEYDGVTKRILKTMRYEHDFEERNYERHRRDAMASERLTSSPHIMDIYNFCGNSGMFELGNEGDLDDAIWPPHGGKTRLSTLDKLVVAHQVATALADVHNADKEGVPSIAHTDITPGQFILINGTYKLNDFNRCRFLNWNEKENKVCGFYVGNNPGKFRAPEEYDYEEETEKIDVYSMGNVFYCLLTELWPFEDYKDKEAQRRIRHGKRPHVPHHIQNTTDPATLALEHAMYMSYVHDVEERATARQVQEYLLKELDKIDPDNAEKKEERL